MLDWFSTTSKDVTLEWKSYDDDEEFEKQIKKVKWTKGTAGDLERNLRSMYTNGIKRVRYAGCNYIRDGNLVGDFQELQNEVEKDIKNKVDAALTVTYVSLSGATPPPKSDNIWEGWNPPQNRVMPPQGKHSGHAEWGNGNRMHALLDALHEFIE